MDRQTNGDSRESYQIEIDRMGYEEEARKRLSRLMHRVVIIGSVVSGLIALVIICTTAYLSVNPLFIEGEIKIPEILGNWGGIILGFYFGTLFSLVKDWMQSSTKR